MKILTILEQKQLTGRGRCILKKLSVLLELKIHTLEHFVHQQMLQLQLVHDTLLNFKSDHRPHVKKK